MSRFEVYRNAERVAEAAAEAFVRAARSAVAQRGACFVAVPGGATPRPFFKALSAEAFRGHVDWDHVHVFVTDERAVPDDHPDSNFGLVRDLLLDPAGVRPENRHRISTELPPAEAAAAYTADIDRHTGGGFDLVVLGMGADGHVASLFPDTDALQAAATGAVANDVPQLGTKRFTLTLPELSRARQVLVLVTDPGKARVLHALRSGESNTPASHLAASALEDTWLLDWDTAQATLELSAQTAMSAEDIEELKRQAGAAAAQEVASGMVVGLGTGSTARYVVETLGARWRLGELRDIRTVPTSQATEILARIEQLPLVDLADHPRIDLTIDGADEVSPTIDLIKGLGGALLREKIVAAASDRLTIVADRGKLVPRLGTQSPVPVAVAPFGWQQHTVPVRDLGGVPTLRSGPDGDPYRTDDGLFILDCRFEDGLDDAAAVDRALRDRVGVVETGLFLGMAEAAYVTDALGVLVYRR